MFDALYGKLCERKAINAVVDSLLICFAFNIVIRPMPAKKH